MAKERPSELDRAEDYSRTEALIGPSRFCCRSTAVCALRPVTSSQNRRAGLVQPGHFLHVSTLEPGLRDFLLAEFPDGDLPANTYYGDGSPLEPEVLDYLRAAYQAETVSFPVAARDLLMLDNMLVAHGRAPYTGARESLVVMAEPVSEEQARL